MATECPEIIIERIRAVISFGGAVFVTPGSATAHDGYIKSFNVHKARTQPTATMSCEIDVLFTSAEKIMKGIEVTSNNVGAMITVRAGVSQDGSDTGVPLIFTGYIMSVRRTPNFNDAKRFVLSISAEDVFVKMKHMKYSRRFKMTDEAFAVITSGIRRQGGPMTHLKRTPGGERGIDKIDSGSSSTVAGEHSPLVRTPDPQNLSPSPFKATGKSNRNDPSADATTYEWEIKEMFGTKGARIFNRVLATDTKLPVDPTKLDRMSCLCHMTPKPRPLGSSASASTGTGMLSGVEYFPAMIEYVTSGKADGIGFIITLTGDYPCKITFVHPVGGATCTMDINVVPPHDHRDAATGGPAVGVYDAWTL